MFWAFLDRKNAGTSLCQSNGEGQTGSEAKPSVTGELPLFLCIQKLMQVINMKDTPADRCQEICGGDCHSSYQLKKINKYCTTQRPSLGFCQ